MDFQGRSDDQLPIEFPVPAFQVFALHPGVWGVQCEIDLRYAVLVRNVADQSCEQALPNS